MIKIKRASIEQPKLLAAEASHWRRWQVDAMLILITLIWGSTFLVVQNSIKLTGPFLFLTLRFGIGGLLLALIFYRRLRHLTRAELLAGSLIGLFLFGGYAFQTFGLQFTTTSKAGFITGLNVIFVPIVCIMLFRQWPTLGAGLGVGLATLGLGLLSVGNSFNLEFGTGELMMLGCALCFALQIVTVGYFAPGKDPYNLAIVQIMITAILSILVAPVIGEELKLPPMPVWISAFFMGAIATAFALAVMNRVQQFTSSTRAALIYALEPVFAGIFGYMAGENLSLPAWIGCVLIFTGMVSSELKFKRDKKTYQVEPEVKEELATV